MGKVHLEWDNTLNVWLPTAQPAGEVDMLVLELVVPEGATASPAVAVPFLQPAANRAIILVPADVTILEGTGAIPVDGLCVQPLETFQLDFNGTERDGDDDLVPEEWITWQSRRLKADGSFEDWDTFLQGNFGPEKTGSLVFVSAKLYGIFQVRAVLTPPDAAPIHFPAVRMRDATNAVNAESIKNSRLAAGNPEYFGVANETLSEFVRNKAVTWLGSTAYRLNTNIKINPAEDLSPNTTGSNKCNIFVAHISNSVGATVPYFYRNGFKVTAPIARLDWFSEPETNIDLDRSGWKNMGTTGFPFPGMIVANHGTGTSGHCGILDYDGSWISAGSATVNKSIHITDPNSKYKPFRMRGRESN